MKSQQTMFMFTIQLETCGWRDQRSLLDVDEVAEVCKSSKESSTSLVEALLVTTAGLLIGLIATTHALVGGKFFPTPLMQETISTPLSLETNYMLLEEDEHLEPTHLATPSPR